LSYTASIAKRRLDWSKRARADLLGILDYYLEEATQSVAVNCLLEVKNSLDRIAILGLQFREGKNETREAP
jgi:plasmid stabilization system protein ParE